MPYKRSSHRTDFETRANFLLGKSRQIARTKSADPDIRDMVLQCAILQTSAALETYLKLLVESWVHQVRQKSLGHKVPLQARVFVASKRLEGHFSKYYWSKQEHKLISALSTESLVWPLIAGTAALPPFFDGKVLSDGSAYPSFKNIKRLFARTGIPDMDKRINARLGRDSETVIEAFQSIRTALAHSNPPNITVKDVVDRIGDMKALVGSIDRIFFDHVRVSCGSSVWT